MSKSKQSDEKSDLKSKKPDFKKSAFHFNLSENRQKNAGFLMNDGSIVDRLPRIQTRQNFQRVVRPHLDIPDDQLNPTQQQFLESSDINRIVRRAQKTGVLPQMKGSPIYGDFSDVPSFQEAQNLLIIANEQFAGLTAVTRARFNNDPAEFLQFATDPKNADKMVEFGLAQPKAIPPEAPIQKVQVVNSEPPKDQPKT